MKTDVAIIGGGPGGATCAMKLSEYGVSSAIIEKDPFPRYQIGESMTGECGAIVRELGLEQEMLAADFPRKHGVGVVGPEGRSSWYVPVMSRASDGSLEETFTWQVRRSTFDKILLDAAVKRGSTLIEGAATQVIRDDTGAVRGVKVRTADGGMEEVHSEVVVDVSGYTTFLCNAGVTSKKTRGHYDKQVAIFSQITGAQRDEGKTHDDTFIYFREKNHWAWFIPIDRDVVSVGVVVPADYLRSKEKDQRAFLLRELREINPALTRRLESIEIVEEVRSRPNYSFHIKEFTGPNYLCVGDCHRFIDPVFSFGLFLTMKEAEIAAKAVKGFFDGDHRNDENPFAGYQAYCDGTLDAVEAVVDGFWDYPLQFAFLAHHRNRDDFIDILAGRVYLEEGQEPPDGFKALQRVMAAKGEGEIADW
jgi:flavin-dependent dehydrogenase